MTAALLDWWDGVELWLSGLDFIWQTVIVMPVVLLAAWLVAVVLDGALGQGARLLRHREPDAGDAAGVSDGAPSGGAR